jgi:hypothetical protein
LIFCDDAYPASDVDWKVVGIASPNSEVAHSRCVIALPMCGIASF